MNVAIWLGGRLQAGLFIVRMCRVEGENALLLRSTWIFSSPQISLTIKHMDVCGIGIHNECLFAWSSHAKHEFSSWFPRQPRWSAVRAQVGNLTRPPLRVMGYRKNPYSVCPAVGIWQPPQAPYTVETDRLGSRFSSTCHSMSGRDSAKWTGNSSI